jgi:excinuclease ABC subunit A
MCASAGGPIDDVCSLTVKTGAEFFEQLSLGEKDAAVADKILREIRRRLGFSPTSDWTT